MLPSLNGESEKIMKKFLTIVLILALLVGLVYVIKNVIPCDEYYLGYKVDEVNKTCIITNGYLYEGYHEISIPEIIEGYRVVGIEENAFANCNGLRKITIPDSVTSIGYNAFANRDSLAYNQYDNAYYLGNDNNPYMIFVKPISNEITSCTINETTEIIVPNAFSECNALTNITIPDSVISISDSAFYKCTALTTVTIGSGITSIGDSTFYGCTGLTSVAIGNGVTIIGDSAFYGCSSLTSITIPDSVTTIGNYAFQDCIGLTNITIGNGVKSIGLSAFEACRSLTSITIPDSVTNIESDAFKYCTQLTGVYITDLAKWCELSFSSTLKTYGEGRAHFSNPLYYAKKLYLNDELVTNLVIPEGVTRIGAGTFCNCESITDITIPASVTSIGSDAFVGCKNLIFTHGGVSYIGDGLKSKVWLVDCNETVVSVNVPSNVVGFADNAFSGCSTLTEITLPSDLLRISDGAFSNCENLKSVSFPIPSKITSIGNLAFFGCKKLQGIYIPNSVTQFGDYVFRGCLSFKKISYGGTTAEWNAIDNFGDNWCVVGTNSIENAFYTGFEIQCSNGVALPRYKTNSDFVTTEEEKKDYVHYWTKQSTIFDKD